MKRRVLIVDDDANFRYAIRELIPWEKYGYEVAGEAIHGKQALDILERMNVQVVLTDMEMPIMNGVELTRMIRERYPEIIVIVMSAFDDFSYVRESMRLGAVDYILKQEFDPEKTMNRIRELVREAEAEQNREFAGSRNKDQMLRYLRGENPSYPQTCPEELKRKRRMRVFVVECRPDTAMEPTEDITALRLCFTAKLSRQRWLFVAETGQSAGGLQHYQQVQEMVRRLMAQFTGEVWIGMCDREGDLSSLPGSYARSIEALEHHLYDETRRIFRWEELREIKRVKDFRYEAGKAVGDTAGTEGDTEVLVDGFCRVMQEMRPDRATLLKNFVLLYRERLAGAGMAAEEEKVLRLYDDLAKCLTITEMRKVFCDTAEREAARAGEQESGARPEVRRAREYIEKHFSEDLSLRDIAEYVGLSENYFSNLFRKETGKSFTGYINEVRIAAAKKLLRETNRKVYQIAEEVGYRSATYFTSLFRKLEGESVSDYRNRTGKNR